METFVDFDVDATVDVRLLGQLRYLSRGGFSHVFAADYQAPGGSVQRVAVKVLKPEFHFKPLNYSKFLQEVAFQTALPHSSIVRAVGFCSVPVGRLISAAPPGSLVPDGPVKGAAKGAKGGPKQRAEAWFAERKLAKCWALVLELMPDGNLFDQVHAAVHGCMPPGAIPAPPPPRPYSDVEALQWLIEAAEAMTYLHGRQPLLIHRDLKLENMLLRREADGQLHVKLSDFGLMVAVDDAGAKLPPPQVLRPPGQSAANGNATPDKGSSKAKQPTQPSGRSRTPDKPAAAPANGAVGTATAGWAAGLQQGAGLHVGAATPDGCHRRRSISWSGMGHMEGGPLGSPRGFALAASPSVQQQPALQLSGPPLQQPQQQHAQQAGAGPAGPFPGLAPPADSPTRHRATGAAVPASPSGAAAGMTLPTSPSSRLSETGHHKVGLDQLASTLRQGKAHKDFMPDLYQMTFKLTSQCGSVCYMAPEVARQLPYNQKVDVFSFGCIAFELLARQLLSDGIPEGNVEAAMEYVGRVAWSSWRPDLPTTLSKELRLLIALCWHREPRLRPSFATVAVKLREALQAAATPSPLKPAALLPILGQSQQTPASGTAGQARQPDGALAPSAPGLTPAPAQVAASDATTLQKQEQLRQLQQRLVEMQQRARGSTPMRASDGAAQAGASAFPGQAAAPPASPPPAAALGVAASAAHGSSAHSPAPGGSAAATTPHAQALGSHSPMPPYSSYASATSRQSVPTLGTPLAAGLGPSPPPHATQSMKNLRHAGVQSQAAGALQCFLSSDASAHMVSAMSNFPAASPPPPPPPPPRPQSQQQQLLLLLQAQAAGGSSAHSELGGELPSAAASRRASLLAGGPSAIALLAPGGAAAMREPSNVSKAPRRSDAGGGGGASVDGATGARATQAGGCCAVM